VLVIKTAIGMALCSIAGFVIWTYVKEVMDSASNPIMDIEQDRMAITRIIITLSFFAITLLAGYLYDRQLSKKLEKLWKQKKALFEEMA